MSDSSPRHPVDALLDARGSSQRWLAAKLRMDETLLSRYLSGNRTAPDGLYERIADVLHVPVSFVQPKPEAPVAA